MRWLREQLQGQLWREQQVPILHTHVEWADDAKPQDTNVSVTEAAI